MTYVILRDRQLFAGIFKTPAEAKAYAKRNASAGMHSYAITENATEGDPFKDIYRATFCIGMRVHWEKVKP